MRLRILGAVQVRDATGWRSAGPAKRAAVLASLALFPDTTVGVTELLRQVWGPKPPEAALSTLYGNIARLRKSLDGTEIPVRSVKGGGYRLDLDAAEVDLHHARAVARRARAEADPDTAAELWHECCAQWRDAPLLGIEGEWARTTREALCAEKLGYLCERFDLELARGRHREILGELEDLLNRHPLSEPLTIRMMMALHHGDRTTEALARYTSLRERMVAELGSEPGDSLRRLHRSLLDQGADAGTTAVPARPVARPPSAPGDFFGRERLLTTVRDLVARHRLVVVDGMAGVGKTALVLHVAHRLAERFPDGQLYCDLRGFSGRVAPLETAEILNRLLRGVGVAARDIPVDIDDRVALWLNRTEGRRLLIVFDNVATVEQLRPVLPESGDCAVLVSSRRRLPELDDARPVTVGVLDRIDAVRLFRAITGNEPDADHDAIGDVVDVCGRLPLAIRLAASRLKNRPGWSVRDLFDRLSRPETTLPELEFAERGVSAAFESSYQDVPESQRRMFRLLGLFPGPEFGAVAAAVLTDTSESGAERLLERLVDSHLLLTAESGRYEFHDLLRRFAVQVLDRDEPEPSRAAAEVRLLEAYRSRTLTAGKIIGPTFMANVDTPFDPSPDITDADAAVAWCRTEAANIVAIVNAQAETNLRMATDLGCGLSIYMNFHARLAELASLARTCAATARRFGDGEAESLWLNMEGLSYGSGTAEHIGDLFARALELRRHTGNRPGQAGLLNNLANFHKRRSEYAKADAMYREAVELAAAAGAKHLEGLALTNLVGLRVGFETADLAEADRLLGIAWSIYEDMGDRREQARVRLIQGNVRRFAGDHGSAVELHRRAVEYFRSHEESVGEVWAHLELARDHAARLDFVGTEHHCAQAERLIPKAGDSTRMWAMTWVERGRAATERGHHRTAVKVLSEAVAAEDGVDNVIRRDAHRHLARAHAALGEITDAHHHRRQAERIDAEIEAAWREA